ncbi:MAG: hypothetical protein Q9219_001045 [cf. Caloplaca sp. 3 TL-2023]
MAGNEVATISRKLLDVESEIARIRGNGEKRQDAIKASQLKPSHLIGDVLEKMTPLTAYVVADGDVTKAEMVDSAQNEHVRTLIKPIQDAFAAANGRYNQARTLTRNAQVTATEDLMKLKTWEQELGDYDARLKIMVRTSTGQRARILADLKRYEAEREELVKKQKKLDERWDDGEKVLHPPDDEPLWKKFGWSLAGMPEEGQAMSDREQLEEAARQDQKAIDEQTDVNSRQIDQTESLIKEQDGTLASTNRQLDKLDTLTKKISETIKDTMDNIKRYDHDIGALDKVSEEMENMFPLLDDATAEAKAGFKIAYRQMFAETILTIMTQLPMDENVKQQVEVLLDSFKAFQKDSKLYAKLQPQLEIVRMKISQQTIKPT